MKTTIDIDAKRLKNVMKLTGVHTRKEAVDYALREAEKSGAIALLVREALPGSEFSDAIAAGYDITRTRNGEKERLS
jgi:Arc/MetJ family transcription regulator